MFLDSCLLCVVFKKNSITCKLSIGVLFFKYSFLVILDVTVNDDGWLKVNPNQTGYYRVNYPLENWKNLAKTLQNDHLVMSTNDFVKMR